jgi:uncharacterized membrane protein YcaP (DUF421 family)
MACHPFVLFSSGISRGLYTIGYNPVHDSENISRGCCAHIKIFPVIFRRAVFISIIFSSWENILRIIIFALCGYTTLVFLLRTTGQRTLSKMNAFDFIITVTIGSTFATLLLASNVALIDGITALAALVGLQFTVTWLTARSDFIKKIIKNEPRLLYYNGEYLTKNMKKTRIVKEEIEQAIRSTGQSNTDNVEAVVMETNGNLSVISKANKDNMDVLTDVLDKE